MAGPAPSAKTKAGPTSLPRRSVLKSCHAVPPKPSVRRGREVPACDVPRLECLHHHIAPRLAGARENSSHTGYRALCPVHDDRDPSLSVSVGEHQRIVWKCHAGCDPLRVRAALIETYRIDRGCLSLSRKEEAALVEVIEDILTMTTKEDTMVRLRALAALRGYRELPHGADLLRLASDIGIGRSQAFEYARRLRGPSPDTVRYGTGQADPRKPRSGRRVADNGESGKPDSVRKPGPRKSGNPDSLPEAS